MTAEQDSEPNAAPAGSPSPEETEGAAGAKETEGGSEVDSQASSDAEPTSAHGLDGLKLLYRQMCELADECSYYVTAQADRLKLSARLLAVRAVTAGLVCLALVAVIVLATWLALVGLAEGLSVLCGDRAWAGKLLAGTLVLGSLALANVILRAWLTYSSRKGTVEKYDELQERRRRRRDHDDAGPAEAPNDGEE